MTAATLPLAKRLRRAVYHGYDASRCGLGVFRIVYALVLLLVLTPVALWTPEFPDALARPPMGLPAALVWFFDGFPPRAFVVALNALVSVAGVCLLAGYRTRIASLAVGIGLLLLNASSYAFGKINHDILFVLVPLVFAFSDWGEALSMDAVRKTGACPTTPPATEKSHSAVIGLFAALIGGALLTAALPKAATGWLSFETQSVLGHTLRNYHVTGRQMGLSGEALHASLPWWWWEVNDWACVTLESIVCLLVLAPRALRVALGVLVLFHSAVFFTMGIFFVFNLVAYAALIHWAGLMRTPIATDAAGALARLFSRLRPWHLVPLVALALVPQLLPVGHDINGTPSLLWIAANALAGGSGDRATWLIGALVCLPLGLAAGLALLYQAWLLTFGRRARATTGEPPLILYDGTCGLCDRAVQFILRRDLDGRFRFAALQSETGAKHLAAAGLGADYRDSLVLVEGGGRGRVHTRSGGAIRIGSQLWGPWKLSGLALLIPATVRDVAYDFVAHNRFRWFGTVDACRLPSPEVRARFLA